MRHRAGGRSAVTGLLLAACLVGASAGPSGAHDEAHRPSGAPRGGSRVGVSRHVIKIGMHAPLTGASPVSSSSMDKGKNLFFRWLRARHHLIHGRRVRVILKNDNYNPSEAAAVCKEMVTQDHVFALVGFAGTEQIRACAHYAAGAHVPYLSPGAAEKGMDLPQTFATSTTWPDQSRLMADYMVTKLKARKRKTAVVWMDTPSYREAKRPYVKGMRRRKADVYSRSVPIGANTADATAVVDELRTRSVKNVYVLVTPSFFLQMVRAASQMDYTPLWTGLDATDALVPIGCGFNDAMDGAKFFSAYPAFGDRDRFDKDFDRAMKRFYPGENSDGYVWGSWAQQKAIAKLLRLPGRNLTRRRFVYFSERAKRVVTGIGPKLHYRPKDHFGADQVHLLKADCDLDRWVTVRSFVDDF